MKEIGRQKIVICGEIFSINLGDAVIADTFSYLLKLTSPLIAVEFLDISLREVQQGKVFQQEVPAFYSQNRLERIAWKIVKKILSTQASTILWWFFKQRPLRYSLYQNRISGASAVVVGGGQLLADNQFDFPLKVYGVSQCAKKLEVPVSYYGCGVSYYWSTLATFFLKKALVNAKSITVRDFKSFERISERIPEITPKLKVNWDLALCCAEAYGISKQESSKYIGVGIAAPAALKRHTRGVRNLFTEDYLLQFWLAVTRKLALEKIPFKIFTNGCIGDQAFAEKVANSIVELGIQSDIILDRPKNQQELVQTISSFQGTIAFRLHACIISHSLCIPSVGLKWDDKVESFFQKCQREKYCLDISSVTPEQIVESTITAVEEGINIDELSLIKSETLYGVKELVENMRLSK